MKFSEENFKSLMALAALEAGMHEMPVYKIQVELISTREIMATLKVQVRGRDVLHLSAPAYTRSHYEADIIERVARMRPYLFHLAITMSNSVGIREMLRPSASPMIYSYRDN